MSLPRYPEYKDSGVAWLGEVPAHWYVCPLKYLVAFSSGGTPSKDKPDYWEGNIPWASAKDLKADKLHDTTDHITQVAVDSGAAALLPAGTVLVVVRGMILARTFPVTQITVPMAINQDLKGLQPGAALDARYLAWLLRGSVDESLQRLDEAGHGTKALRMDAWTSMQLPVPPKDEQTEIATFLDRETGKIDVLIAEQEKLLRLLAEKRQATISHAVTKGLNPDAPMKDSGVEWLGEVPRHWAITRIKYVVEARDGIQMGPFGGMLLDLNANDTGFKVYGQENTISGDFSRGTRWISDKRFRELERYRLRIGDLVLTRKGSLGNARLVQELPQPGICDSDTIRVRVDEQSMRAEFLTTLLHEADYVALQLAMTKRGAILSGVNTETIANLCVIVPPSHEQNEILEFLKVRLAELQSVADSVSNAIALLKERRAALIAAAITGKIDVRGAVAD